MSEAVIATRRPALQTATLSLWGVCLLSLMLPLLPLLCVEVPPILDYPNHLARAMVIALDGSDPDIARMAVPHWGLLPNLGLDLILPPLARLLPLDDAGRIMLALTLLLPMAGGLAYSKAVFGRLSPWSFGVCLVACNAAFLMGFVNFLLSVGIALLAASDWVTRREGNPLRTMAISCIATLVLFFFHLMGLVAYLILIGSRELEMAAKSGSFPSQALRRAIALMPPLVLPAILFATSPLSTVVDPPLWANIPWKLTRALFPFTNYILTLDIVTAFAVGAFLVWCACTGRLSCPVGSLAALCLFALGYIAAPFAYKGTMFIDIRFEVVLGFLAFTCVSPKNLPPRLARAATVGFVLLALARTSVVGYVWHGYGADLAGIQDLVAQVNPGDKVLVAVANSRDDTRLPYLMPSSRMLSDGTTTDAHRAALVMTERHAFWPFLFAIPSQQPISLVSPYKELANDTPNMPTLHELGGVNLSEQEKSEFPLWDGQWFSRYDWVLILDQMPSDTQTTHLRRVGASSAATLYKTVNQ